MIEAMMKAKDTMRPYPFEKIMSNCIGFKHNEVVDGLKVSMMFPLGP